MSHFTSELAELVDLFCEGDIAAEQATRLEALVAESAEARQYLLDCFQVHCELAWEFGRESGDASQPVPCTGVSDYGVLDHSVPTSRVPAPHRSPLQQKRRRLWVMAATAVALLVAVTLGLSTALRSGSHKTDSHAPAIAHIEQANDVRWCDGAASAIDAPLPAGSKLAFQQGLLEVVFQSGPRLILQGPAEVELQSQSSVVLLHGKLTADVPAAARGFTIHTPNATVVDLGTKFGVAFQAGQTDVEVFVGKVLLRLDGSQSGGASQELPLLANSAVRVSGVSGQGALKIEPFAVGSWHFVQSLVGSASLLQALVEGDPHLIHSYPFQGATNAERFRDRRGNLDLHEVIMRDGDGGQRLEFKRSGPDPSIQVVAAGRGEPSGGVRGRGLQSDAVFQPPAAMTVELLLDLSRLDKSPEGFIASAVATRHDLDHCGFLVTAVRDGELTCLLDGGGAMAAKRVQIHSRPVVLCCEYLPRPGGGDGSQYFCGRSQRQEPQAGLGRPQPGGAGRAGPRSAGHWQGF